MEIHADFERRVHLRTDDLEWMPSPMPGVERRMLDRIGTEVARATSIVRYAASSAFAAHVHTGGEEFIVLDGVFQDEHGDYPAGTYVRNPPRSSHTPRSGPGCTILVKLWQFDLEDRTPVVAHLDRLRPTDARDRPGVAVASLFCAPDEDVRLEVWLPGADVSLQGHRGLELFVLQGGFDDGTSKVGPRDWLRLPPKMPLRAVAGPEGARIWVKSGHLNPPRHLGVGG